MTAAECPDGPGCPVPDPPAAVQAERFRVHELPANTIVCRAFQLKWGYDSFNPGFGDTRFAPIGRSTGHAIPTLYGGVDDVGVLLETVFHDVHHQVADRVIYEALVRRWGLAFVRLPRALTVIDLRDGALAAAGLTRGQLVTTTAEHYPCTRVWSRWLHDQRVEGRHPDGLLWHSRQAELHPSSPPREVFLLWGDRAPSGPGNYPLASPGVRNLTEGPGRMLLERLAEDLDARVEPADDA